MHHVTDGLRDNGFGYRDFFHADRAGQVFSRCWRIFNGHWIPPFSVRVETLIKWKHKSEAKSQKPKAKSAIWRLHPIVEIANLKVCSLSYAAQEPRSPRGRSHSLILCAMK
jgi:hypothetical protein